MTTPEFVRMLRLRKGFKQAYIAQRIGISQTYYSKLESGKKEFTKSHLELIAEIYQVPSTSLKQDMYQADPMAQSIIGGQTEGLDSLIAELLEARKENKLLKAILEKFVSGGGG